MLFSSSLSVYRRRLYAFRLCENSGRSYLRAREHKYIWERRAKKKINTFCKNVNSPACVLCWHTMCSAYTSIKANAHNHTHCRLQSFQKKNHINICMYLYTYTTVPYIEYKIIFLVCQINTLYSQIWHRFGEIIHSPPSLCAVLQTRNKSRNKRKLLLLSTNQNERKNRRKNE